jgi:hypothetical protein
MPNGPCVNEEMLPDSGGLQASTNSGGARERRGGGVSILAQWQVGCGVHWPSDAETRRAGDVVTWRCRSHSASLLVAGRHDGGSADHKCLRAAARAGPQPQAEMDETLPVAAGAV